MTERGKTLRETRKAAWQDAIRLHLQVLTIRRAEGRLKFLAGSESAMGAFVNDLSPEGTAARLRDVQLPA